MVFDKLKEIAVDILGDSADSITMDSRFKDDLEMDSLDAVELIMSAEEEFGIEIPDEVAMNMKTVREIVDYIEKNI